MWGRFLAWRTGGSPNAQVDPIRHGHRARSTLRLSLLVAGALVIGALPVLAQDDQASAEGAASTVPPGGDPLGTPYGTWADRWWEWILSIPASENPLFTGDCQVGQGGEVFFLPQVLAPATVEAQCEIGANQWILVSPGSVVWTNDEGESVEELQAVVEGDRDVFSGVSVAVNGAEVADIDSYWVIGPGQQLTFGEDNVFEYEPGTVRDVVAGGWFVMLPPLEPGSHTITVRDDIDPGDGTDPQTAEYTAYITVESAE